MELVSCKDYEEKAKTLLPDSFFEFYSIGASQEKTMQNNLDVFDEWYLRTKFMTDVSSRSMESRILGHKVSAPIGVSPFAFQKLAHKEGEVALARGALKEGTIYTLPLYSTSSIEEVAESGDGVRFFQIYLLSDRNFIKNCIKRAERGRYSGIVITIDTPCNHMLKTNFVLPSQYKLSNFEEIMSNSNGDPSAMNEYIKSVHDETVTWKDLHWLKSLTDLPIIVKGVHTPEDANLAVEYGASAVWISNHGGKGVDGVPATLQVLPEIVDAVRGRCEIYVDGGFRCGSDIFKALAIGANAVFLGRPFGWALACKGEEGVRDFISLLKSELDIAMAVTGCINVQGINRTKIRHKSSFTT